MRKCKLIFSILTVILCVAGLLHILPNDITLPLALFFLGITLLIDAKASYDKGAKWYAVILAGTALFVYVIIFYNLFSRIFGF